MSQLNAKAERWLNPSKARRGANTGSILCCQCIVDGRESVRTATHAHVVSSSFLSLVILPSVLLSLCPSSLPQASRHVATDLCFCEPVKPLLVERFFCPMLVMHKCTKPILFFKIEIRLSCQNLFYLRTTSLSYHPGPRIALRRWGLHRKSSLYLQVLFRVN